MKLKILLTLILSSSIIFNYSQKNYEEVKVYKDKKIYHSSSMNTFKEGNSVYSFYRTNNNSNSPKLLVSKIVDNKQIKSKELDLSDIYYPFKIEEIEGGAAILYIERVKKESSDFKLKLVKFNFDNFSIEKGNEILVKELSKKDIGMSMFNETPLNERKLGVDLSASDNGKYLSVCYYSMIKGAGNKNNVFNYAVYGSKLNKIFGKKLRFNEIIDEKYKKALYGFHVNNSGIIQGMVYNQKKGNTHILSISKSGISHSKKLNNFFGHDFLTKLDFPIFYNNKNGQKTWFKTLSIKKKFHLGIYTYDDSLKHLSQNFIDLSDYLLEIESYSDYIDYRLENLIAMEDGSIVFNFEISAITMGSGFVTKEDIVIIKMDKSNKILWDAKIPKLQSQTRKTTGKHYRIGFTCTKNSKGHLMYLFNSIDKRHPGLSKKSHTISGLVEDLACIVIDEKNGELLSEKIIFMPEKEEHFSPLTYKYFEDRTYLFGGNDGTIFFFKD